MQVTALIEKGEDNFYSAFIVDDIPGFAPAGYGESVQEAKSDLFTNIEEFRELAREEGKAFPEQLDVRFRYDIPSFFN